MKFKTKQQLDAERPTYALLPQDDYELIITNLEEKERPKYMKPNETEQIIDFILEIQGTRDDTKALDVDGVDATGRRVYFTARPNSVGFQQDGTPSKTRTFVAYALGFNVEDEFELEAWEQLLGKTIYAEITQYTNKKGNKGNKISRFLLPPKRGKVKVDIKDTDIPVIE